MISQPIQSGNSLGAAVDSVFLKILVFALYGGAPQKSFPPSYLGIEGLAAYAV